LVRPACAAVETVAAVVVALGAKKAKEPLAYWAAASLVATMTGNLACGCVGASGVAALVIAFALSSLPASYVASKA
jgi:flagellar motor component MotA